jgi:hypothetical protein
MSPLEDGRTAHRFSCLLTSGSAFGDAGLKAADIEKHDRDRFASPRTSGYLLRFPPVSSGLPFGHILLISSRNGNTALA